jgi:branched-chain amino acid transport system ATP-binding protein
MGMPDAILETEGLTKSFGALAANDRISLSIREGDIHGIIGPNGSGKSTFFNTVSGFYKPTDGSIYFDGEEVTGWAPHDLARAGLLRTFQISRPFTDMSVRDNLLVVYTPGLRVGGEKRARADEILELLEIDHLADHEAGDLSGGQQKLLELARVFMLDPDLVLLDEPLAGVNPALQSRILSYLQTLNDEGTSFAIIEHNMRVIDEITDVVTVFNHGQTICQGTFEEVKSDERVRDAYLGGGETSIDEVLA